MGARILGSSRRSFDGVGLPHADPYGDCRNRANPFTPTNRVMVHSGDTGATLQPLAPRQPLGAIDAVYLKDLLGQIHAHTSKLHDDPSSFRDWWHTPPVWHLMPLGVRRGPSHCFIPETWVRQARCADSRLKRWILSSFGAVQSYE
jgi:hypothetical protein